MISIVSTGAVASDAILAQTSDYTTYFGGTGAEDATKVTFDNDGNTILIGQTTSTDLPLTSGAFQTEYGGGDWDAFIAKFSPSGALLFSSYFGGSSYEHVTWVNVDSDNNIVIAGNTYSSGLPTTPGALHVTPIGSGDGFIAKIAPNGTILYCTYFGGTGEDWIYGMEFDGNGNYMFAGWTTSSGLGTTGAYEENYQGLADGFIARVGAGGSNLQMFSYLGGPGNDRCWTMAIDSSYNYVVGGLAGDGFPISGDAHQGVQAGGTDAFIAKIDHSGSSLNFSTFLGGTDDDGTLGVDVDSHDNLLLAGYTKSDDITTLSAAQSSYAGGDYDMLVAKFNATGTAQFVTYLGGNETDRCWDVRADSDDNAVIIGRTDSYDYPAFNGLNDTKSGAYDACATKVSTDGSTFLASAFIGGSSSDIGEGIDVDNEGNVVVTGRTFSDDFPVTVGAYEEDAPGGSDVFVCHTAFISPPLPTTTPTSPTTTPAGLPGSTTLLIVGVGVAALVVLAVVCVKRR